MALGLLAAGPAWATDTNCDGGETDGGGYVCNTGGAGDIPDISAAGNGNGAAIGDKLWTGDNDDGYYGIGMGQSFTWYGNSYSQVYISTNGYVTFNSAGASTPIIDDNLTNPNTADPDATVYGFGDDLTLANAGTVYYDPDASCTGAYSGDTCFVVRWDGVEIFGEGGSSITVELALNFDQNLAIVEIVDETTADTTVPQIVGTENADGTQGLWYLGATTSDQDSRSTTTGDAFIFQGGDSTAPTVTGTTPADGATGVGVGADVVVDFSEAMDTSSVTLEVLVGTDPGGFSPSWSNGDQTVTYTHNDFAELTDYTLGIDGNDASPSGNALDPSNSPVTEGGGGPAGCGTTKYCWSFTTQDNTAPSDTDKQTTTSISSQVDVEWADLPPTGTGGPTGLIVLQRVGDAVTATPTDGVEYAAGDQIGDSFVACKETDTTSNACTDSIYATNNSTNYYKSFVYDAAFNYSSGNQTTAVPGTVFDWAFTSAASILNRVVPIPNDQVVGIGNDRLLHRLRHDDGLRSGWDPPLVGGAVQGTPNALSLNPSGAADLTAYASAQNGFTYRFSLDGDGAAAENTLDVIDYVATNTSACQGVGSLQGGPVVLFDEFSTDPQGDPVDGVVQATRCGSADNAVVLMGHDLTVDDTYSDDPAEGDTGDGLGISNAAPYVLYRDGGFPLVYVPLGAGDAEGSSLLVLEVTDEGDDGILDFANDTAFATVTGKGALDATPALVRRTGDPLMLIGNTDGDIYLFQATTRDGSSLNELDSFVDADGLGGVNGLAAGNYLTVGGNEVNYVVWSTSDTVHGITIGDTGRFVDGSYWSQSIDSPSEPLILQYGGNTYAYVGAGDGNVYELDARNGGTITDTVEIEAGTTVGDPSLDTGAGPSNPSTQGITVGTTSGRIYWISLE